MSTATALLVMCSVAVVTMASRRVYAATKGRSAFKDPLYLLIVVCYAGVAYFFYRASFDSPGYLPRKWRPTKKRDRRVLDYCRPCEGYKAPRAHHCRRCGRCVQRMDHHCPWIGNCVGLRNQAVFFCFLAMYLVATALSIYSLSRVLVVGFDRPEMFRMFREAAQEPRMFSFFQCGAVGFTLVPTSVSIFGYLSVLFFAQQLRNVLFNLTVLERMQISQLQKKYPHRIIPRPYDLGVWENLRQLIKMKAMDGISYPVKDGVDEHALVKLVLRDRDSMMHRKNVRKHAVVKSYSGHMMPLGHGCATMMSAPVTESRLPVEPGDEIFVSRREGLWAYGHNVDTAQSGWLPQDCVKEVGPQVQHLTGEGGGGVQPVALFANYNNQSPNIPTEPGEVPNMPGMAQNIPGNIPNGPGLMPPQNQIPILPPGQPPPLPAPPLSPVQSPVTNQPDANLFGPPKNWSPPPPVTAPVVPTMLQYELNEDGQNYVRQGRHGKRQKMPSHP
jgi:hypothetical protein